MLFLCDGKRDWCFYFQSEPTVSLSLCKYNTVLLFRKSILATQRKTYEYYNN